MPTCVIDGKEVKFKEGENLIEVAKNAGINIPFFCYHPGLSVVAQCRMCAVEIEKMPKLQTACSTPIRDGMVIHTQSDRVKEAQKSTMEFLLINHPLDCPICDKSGECDLQDFSFEHGDAYSRYTEERRTYMDLDMGPVIKKNMNRCIHCTRCIRFGDEVAGIREMVAVQRGNNTEITTFDGRALETDYAGNYSDICPTGSLTLKDFRFKKRAWMLKKTSTVCEGCSRGCNMEIQQDADTIYRCIPVENMEINRHWMCDEGRFNYRYVNSDDRVVEPALSEEGKLKEVDWSEALDRAVASVNKENLLVLIGSDLTQEEGKSIQDFVHQSFPSAKTFHFGTPGVLNSSDDANADALLKRKSKTANLNGMEKLGIKPFEKVPSNMEAVLVFTGGRAKLPDFGADQKKMKTVGIGVFKKPSITRFDVILPGPSFAEKSGTIFNFENREQKFKKAIHSPGSCKPLSEILMMWTHRRSSTGAA